ncbi:MAG: TlpA family protein disulfide reductase [Bryobacteraceae bacterium]|nr:TlpA family protein disulfide reductase [Bryobacteraceae bacterium]
MIKFAVKLVLASSILLGQTARPAAPSFQLRDQQGRTRTLADFHGRPLILNFWATWCRPCRTEMPWLDQVQRNMPGVAVVGVAMDEQGWRVVTPFLAQYRVSYTILLGAPEIARAYGGLKTLPETVFIDREGRVVAAHKGLLSRAQLEKIAAALARE